MLLFVVIWFLQREIFFAMAIAVSATVTGSVTTGNTVTLTSWTPAAYDLILLGVATREDDSVVVSVTGNGLTWQLVKSLEQDDEESRLRIYRAMGSAPTTGSIVVTLSGNTLPVMCVATRLSGCDMAGVSGSGAVETYVYDDGPGGSSNGDMLKSVTTITTNAWALAFGTHRDQAFTTPGGEVTISINNTVGTGSNMVKLSVWYQTTTAPGPVTVGASNDLAGATDWAIIVVSIKPSLIETSEVISGNYRRFKDRKMRVQFKTAAGDSIMSAWGYCAALSSEYKGNEVEGIQVKDTIRGNFDKTLRQKIVKGDYMFINPVHGFQIMSIKEAERACEVVASLEQKVPAVTPDIIVPLDLSAATAEIEIWQPVNGKRFRLMEVEARIGGQPSCKLIFRDGLAGSIILIGSTTNVYSSGRLGAGKLSARLNNPLTVERTTSCTLQGHILGFEE
jgi:flavoprotein